MVTCEYVSQSLLEYLEGGLDQGTRQAFAAHFGSCLACAYLTSSYEKTRELCRLAVEQAPPHGLADRLVGYVREGGKSS